MMSSAGPMAVMPGSWSSPRPAWSSGREVADVVPAEGGRHHRDAARGGGGLGDGVVDGDLGRRRPQVAHPAAGQPAMVRRWSTISAWPSASSSSRSWRRRRTCLRSNGIGRSRRSSVAVSASGFSTKLVDAARARCPLDGERLAEADVAESRCGPGGLDPDGDELAAPGEHHRLAIAASKAAVSRMTWSAAKLAQHRLGVASLEDRGGQADGRHRVPG